MSIVRRPDPMSAIAGYPPSPTAVSGADHRDALTLFTGPVTGACYVVPATERLAAFGSADRV